MKNLKKILALVMVVAMMAALGVCAFAQDVGSDATGKGTITISNPYKGVTYYLYKVFDATVSADVAEDSGIQYVATAAQKTAYEDMDGNVFTFTATADSNKYYVSKKSGVEDSAVTAFLEGMITKPTATSGSVASTLPGATSYAKHETSDGTGAMNFKGLDYGYYLIVNDLEYVAKEGNISQYSGSCVAINSTTPSATITVKNDASPIVNPSKTANDEVVYIGEDVQYTVTFNTNNYDSDGKAITSYEIIDSLPDFLTVKSVDSIKVAGNTVASDKVTNSFTSDGKIVLAWSTKNTDEDGNVSYTFNYNAGAQVEIKYTATVTGAAVVGTNTNTVTINAYADGRTVPDGDDPDDEPDPNPWTDTVTEDVATYAAAFKKVDSADNTKALAGAKFTLSGYTLSAADVLYDNTGKEVARVYTVTAKDATGDNAPENPTVSTVETGTSGVVIIRGLDEQTLKNDKDQTCISLTETAAPEGYNKMTEAALVPVIQTGETTKTLSEYGYYAADGTTKITENSTSNTEKTTLVDESTLITNAQSVTVANSKGTELPETGGIGTTIFYVVGGILVVGAGVLLVTKKRMSSKG